MADEVERAKALEDLQHALIVDDDELKRDVLRRLGHDDVSDELSDREKVDGLRGLVMVELFGAHEMEPDADGRVTDYVRGRIASYELVLDAIGRRWPELQHWQAEVEHFYERVVGMEPPSE